MSGDLINAPEAWITDVLGKMCLNVNAKFSDEVIDKLVEGLLEGLHSEDVTILNESYPTANVIQSHAFTDSTKKFLLRHREKGAIEFSFDASLTTYMTIPCGGSIELTMLNLTSKTIYFRSGKIGTIELMEWV